MTRQALRLALIVVVVGATPPARPAGQARSPSNAKTHVMALASDRFEGRLAGSAASVSQASTSSVN